MKSLAMFLALAIAAVAGVAATQETSAATARDTSKGLTADGEVVRYEAGKTIVLRQPDKREVAYEIAPTLIVPAEVRVGRHVSIVAETASDGTLRVTSITALTADVAPSGGQLKQTTTYTHDAEKTPKTVIVTGDVVRYEAGKAIVIASDGGEVTYAIAPKAEVPHEVAPGTRVSIVTEPSEAGPVLVTRIALDGANVDGTAVKAAPDEGTRTRVTTVYGTVSAYEPGRSLTVLRPNGTTATYSVDAASSVPDRIAAGRKVVVRTITRPGGNRPLVREVSFSKRTEKTSK